MLHILLHIVVPGLAAGVWFRGRWRFAWLLMLATMLVDLDHLLADPVYDPNRCSIGFHPLHGAWPIALYVVMMAVPRFRLLGLGLVIHMLLDSIDCQLNTGSWIHPG